MKNIYGRFVIDNNQSTFNSLKDLVDMIKEDVDKSLEFEQNPHCTVIYVKDSTKIEDDIKNQILNLYPGDTNKHTANIVKFSKLKSSLVLELNFTEAVKRHNEYVRVGYVHSYPTYNCHLTLINNFPYDLNKIPERAIISAMELIKTINFQGYKCEELEGMTGTNEIVNKIDTQKLDKTQRSKQFKVNRHRR